MYDVEIVCGSKTLGILQVSPSRTISEIKSDISRFHGALAVNRQAIRTEVKGKSVKDSATIGSLGVQPGNRLYVKDLGPQIAWKTVFLVEYAGPLLVYLWMFQRPWIFFGTVGVNEPISLTADLACLCWSLHYIKRLLETLFIHRFSHATMPVTNLFKNCSYYWIFTMYVGYHINHPKYVDPNLIQVYMGLAAFLMFEYGNLSCHIALRNLRPAGTTTRKIPKPTANIFTILFDYVSCPNYFYEAMSWLSFSIMTNSMPAVLFAFAGFYQMTVWAIVKHRKYKEEFLSYPMNRKAIIPFLL